MSHSARAQGKEGSGEDPVLADPELSPSDRTLIEANPWALLPAAHTPAAPIRADSGFYQGQGPLFAVLAAGSGIAGGLVDWFAFLCRPHGGVATTWETAPTAVLLEWAAYFLFVLAVFGGVGMAIAAATAGLSKREQRRITQRTAELRGRYLRPTSDLDSRGQRLLRRARAAATAITSSEVHADGALDTASHNVRLPALVWGVGRDLAELKTVKDQAEHAAAGGGAAVNAVVAPYREAITRGFAAIERRVAALEAYAEDVVRLDTQHRALKASEALEGTLLELEVGRGVRDAAELDEVAAMTRDLPASRTVLEQELAAAAERLSALASAPSPSPDAAGLA